jgi:cation:H+ antiporter
MELLIQSVILFVSLAILSKSSHIVTDNSVKIAKITRLGELVIGFILLSIASSMPEIAVAFSAVTSGNVEITLGDIFGSNIADIVLVVGLMALISPIKIYKRTMKELSTMLFLTSLITLLLFVIVFPPRIVGFILIFTFLIFCHFSVKRRVTFKEFAERRKKVKLSIVLPLVLGLFFIILSSRFAVDSAANIANILGISSTVIGATIIAIGTVLPELAVGIASIKKNHVGLALGNTIGSCVVKVTVVLGSVLLMAPIITDLSIYSTLIGFMIFSAVLIWFFFGKGRLDRIDGIFLILFYVLFLLAIFGIETFLTFK